MFARALVLAIVAGLAEGVGDGKSFWDVDWQNPSTAAAELGSFSVAGTIHDKFEAAYAKRKAQLGKNPAKKIEAVDKERYGKGYYQDKLWQMKKGYQHPYHSEQNPLVQTHYQYMKHLMAAAGPEQVSPHYESLARSRRALIFIMAYIGVITSISRLGGWSHNEWIRNMICHHEYMICFYLSFIEMKHFTWAPGPKFSIFYRTYTRYEAAQLGSMWADQVERSQAQHLIHTKEQIEYVRLNNEYDYIKKRALVNFLTNQRTELENHMSSRASNMLHSIERVEAMNLKNLLNGIGKGALAKVNAAVSGGNSEIQEAAFQCALGGIRDGSMTYKGDPLMPILTEEINSRVTAYKNMSIEEQGKLMALNNEQKRMIADADKRDKSAFLNQTPNIQHATVRQHPKFVAFAEGKSSH